MTSSEGGYPALILYKNNIQRAFSPGLARGKQALILYKNNIQPEVRKNFIKEQFGVNPL